MKLFIDTSNSEKITVKAGNKTVERESRERKSQTLLEAVQENLAEGAPTAQGQALQALEAIEVNTGPGSFTGLRVGVSVANALGYSLGIPVNGKNVIKDGPVEPTYDMSLRGTLVTRQSLSSIL